MKSSAERKFTGLRATGYPCYQAVLWTPSDFRFFGQGFRMLKFELKLDQQMEVSLFSLVMREFPKSSKSWLTISVLKPMGPQAHGICTWGAARRPTYAGGDIRQLRNVVSTLDRSNIPTSTLNEPRKNLSDNNMFRVRAVQILYTHIYPINMLVTSYHILSPS